MISLLVLEGIPVSIGITQLITRYCFSASSLWNKGHNAWFLQFFPFRHSLISEGLSAKVNTAFIWKRKGRGGKLFRSGSFFFRAYAARRPFLLSILYLKTQTSNGMRDWRKDRELSQVLVCASALLFQCLLNLASLVQGLIAENMVRKCAVPLILAQSSASVFHLGDNTFHVFRQIIGTATDFGIASIPLSHKVCNVRLLIFNFRQTS